MKTPVSQKLKNSLAIALLGIVAITGLGFGLLTMGLAIVVGTVFGIAAHLSSKASEEGPIEGEVVDRNSEHDVTEESASVSAS